MENKHNLVFEEQIIEKPVNLYKKLIGDFSHDFLSKEEQETLEEILKKCHDNKGYELQNFNFNKITVEEKALFMKETKEVLQYYLNELGGKLALRKMLKYSTRFALATLVIIGALEKDPITVGIGIAIGVGGEIALKNNTKELDQEYTKTLNKLLEIIKI